MRFAFFRQEQDAERERDDGDRVISIDLLRANRELAASTTLASAKRSPKIFGEAACGGKRTINST